MAAISCGQFSAVPASANTRAAASKALRFWPVGAAAGGGGAGGVAAAGGVGAFRVRGVRGGVGAGGAIAAALWVFAFFVAICSLLHSGVPRCWHRGRRGAPAQ